MNKIITVSIIGVGARGGDAYGRYINELKDKFKIVSLCDFNPEKINKYKDVFDVPEEQLFHDEESFFKEKRSDLLVVATPDKEHYHIAMKALDLGYDLLLEKPISDKEEELKSLAKKVHETNRKVMVCHVLRYTDMIIKTKELLDSKIIGELVTIDHIENIAYYHYAHSYVRGNWHSSKKAAPIIMAKCCHDLDLLQYFVSSKCKYISSMGDLRFFKKENQPEGASERCLDCKYQNECPYSAKMFYLDDWYKRGCPENEIFFNLITNTIPLTHEALEKSLRETDYGRCVFDMDNDVADNETTIMTFENGVTATLRTEAFTADGGREIRFFGTLGEIQLIEAQDSIIVRPYRKAPIVYKISEISRDTKGLHGGGDHMTINSLYEYLMGNGPSNTSIDSSIESHYMALAAEESRTMNGKLIEVKKYR